MQIKFREDIKMNKQYRKPVIAGNWKMNMLPSQVKTFGDELNGLIANTEWCDKIICAPYVLLPVAISAFKDGSVAVGAQNVSEHADGAFTGEVSASQLTDTGVSYVIIGHSERRQYFHETDLTVNKKVLLSLDIGLKPIICVGETEQQRESGITNELIALQIKAAFSNIPEEQLANIIVAYEPVWAIGTGKTATPEQAGEVCGFIRSFIGGIYSEKTACGIVILYGGSMNDENARELLAQPDIDGGLIGGASLVPAKFAAIIEAANQ